MEYGEGRPEVNLGMHFLHFPRVSAQSFVALLATA
jgi:hypothetical protein